MIAALCQAACASWSGRVRQPAATCLARQAQKGNSLTIPNAEEAVDDVSWGQQRG